MYHFSPKRYCIIDIFPSRFVGAEWILLLSKIIELIFYPSMITSFCITFQECKDFFLLEEIRRFFDIAGMKVISCAVSKADLFVECLTKSKSKELISILLKLAKCCLLVKRFLELQSICVNQVNGSSVPL